MILIPFPDTRLYLPSAPPGKSSSSRTPNKLRKRLPTADPGIVVPKQAKKGTVKKLLKKPRVVVGAFKSVLAKVPKAKKHHNYLSNVSTDTDSVLSAPDDTSSDSSEGESAIAREEVEIGDGDEYVVEDEVVTSDISSVAPLDEVEVAEEDGPISEVVPDTIPDDTPGTQLLRDEEDNGCIACILGIGHGISDVESDVSQEVEDSLASTEPGSEVPASILDAETEVISSVTDQVEVAEVNEIVTVENESSIPQDTVAEQAGDSTESLEVALVAEVPASILDEETEVISSVVDEVKIVEVNETVNVENESSVVQDAVAQQAGDPTESLEAALVVYANAGTTAEDLPSLTCDLIPTPAAPDAPDTLSPSVSALLDISHDSSTIVKAPVVYANAGTSTDDLSYVPLDLIPISKPPSPSPSVSAPLDTRPVTISVDAHTEVSNEVRAETITALIKEAVAHISDVTGLPPSAIIQFAANLYSHEVLVPSAAQSATPEAPASTKVTAEVSIQTDDVPVSTELTEEEVDGHIISPLKEREREEEFELIDRVMRGARAGKRAALDVGEQMVWFGIHDKILDEKYILIIQKGSIPNVFKILPPKPIIPVFELEDIPEVAAPPPPPPPGPPPPPPPAALAPPPLVSCGRKTLALPAPSSDTPSPADPSAPPASPTPAEPVPDPAAERAAQEAARAKARAELRAAIMQRQENGVGLRNAQDRVLRPAEPKSEVAPWQQEMLRRNGSNSSRTDNVAGPSMVQQESDAEPEAQPRFQLRATGRSLVDEPTQQTGSDDTAGNVAGASGVQQEPDAESYVRPLFQLRATGRSLVDESIQQTPSDDAPGMDISNLRANLRRVGRGVGNENEGMSSSSRKGKGVFRPPLRSVNGPRGGSA